MESTGSITFWIGQLKAGEPMAAQKLWEGYYQKMVELARKKLEGMPRRAADEEDVALSAFYSFCRGAAGQRFPDLTDRNGLWPLLVAITAHKAIDLMRHERRLKRGGPSPTLTQPSPQGGEDPERRGPEVRAGGRAALEVEDVIGREPTPEFALQVAEEYRRLLDGLGDDGLRAVAQWKMEGYSTPEIAARLGCVPRTVDRKLGMIRRLWEQEKLP
jgi:DNA-directed RNA polymerase specialized sigma24 family protein